MLLRSFRPVWFALVIVLGLQILQPMHDVLAHDQDQLHCEFCVAAPGGVACAWDSADVLIIAADAAVSPAPEQAVVASQAAPSCRDPPHYL